MDHVRGVYEVGTFSVCGFQYEGEPECAVSMYKMQKDRIGWEREEEHWEDGVCEDGEEEEFIVFE